MAYDFVRWGAAIVIFAALTIILIKVTKNKGKSVLIASFAAIITFAVLLLIPVENYLVGFKSVEKIFSYRYHEDLLTYAECDEGVLCIGKKGESDYVYYTFKKDDGKYLLPKMVEGEKIIYRSSQYGQYLIKRFENQVLVVTSVKESEYDGVAFKKCDSGFYYYTIVDSGFDYSLLTCSGERVALV